MQIGDQGTLNKRLFNYGTSLRNINEYKNCYSIGISISSNNIDSNSVRLKKKTRTENFILDYIQTIEINIDEELANIENGVDVIINGKTLNNDGKEFIKLFGLRKWATKIGNRYALPNFNNLEIAQNTTIKECIEILASIDDYQLLEMIADEKYYTDIVTENFKKGVVKGHGLGLNDGLIIGAFSFLSITNDITQIYNYLKRNNVIFKDENQVRTVLSGKDTNDIDIFINYLKAWKFL